MNRLRFLLFAGVCFLFFHSCRKKVEHEFVLNTDSSHVDANRPIYVRNNSCHEGELIRNSTAIEGYTDKQNYYPGEPVIFYIHSHEPLYNWELYRAGEELLLIDKKEMDNGAVQNYYCYSYSHGCNWNKTINYRLPPSIKTGMYSAKISNVDGEFWITFIVKPASKSADIAVIASTNTWAAYNDWGGGSFYRHRVEEDVAYSENISFRRPNPYLDPTSQDNYLAGSEVFLLKWLEIQGYNYDQYADRDLHENGALFRDYKVVALQCHPEYYTRPMYDALYRFVNQGGNLIMLGANGVYWKVVIDPIYEILEVRHSGSAHYFDKSEGGRWSSLGYPESGLLGVSYTRSGYDTYKPYKVIDADHWTLKNTGLKKGEEFGAICSKVAGASGLETDKMNEFSPKNTKLIAKGTNPDNGGAEMIYYMNSSGGKVFSVGSITYNVCLLSDPHISQITKNVFDEFLK